MSNDLTYTPGMSPLERVAGRPTWLLSRADARAQALLAAGFAAEGFRGYHYRLLAALDQYGPSSQADLGRYTGIDRSDVVAALNELADGGFIQRDPDPADRRRNVVSVTRSGRPRSADSTPSSTAFKRWCSSPSARTSAPPSCAC